MLRERWGRAPTVILVSYFHTAVAEWWVQWWLDSAWGYGFGDGSPSGAICPTWSSSPAGAAVTGWPGCCCEWAGWGSVQGREGRPGAPRQAGRKSARAHLEGCPQWDCSWALFPRFPQLLWCPRRTAAGRCSGVGCSDAQGSRHCQRPPRSSAHCVQFEPQLWKRRQEVTVSGSTYVGFSPDCFQLHDTDPKSANVWTFLRFFVHAIICRA